MYRLSDLCIIFILIYILYVIYRYKNGKIKDENKIFQIK